MLLQMYPKNVATIYAMTESCFSFAEMIGPTLGALMYNVGGFILPFEVCGGLCLLTGKQCDQIGRFFTLWVAFPNLKQQLFCPNHQHFRQFFEGVKIFNFSNEIIFVQFFNGHAASKPNTSYNLRDKMLVEKATQKVANILNVSYFACFRKL